MNEEDGNERLEEGMKEGKNKKIKPKRTEQGNERNTFCKMNGGRRFDRIVGEGLTDLYLNHKTLILFSYNSKTGQDYLQIFQDQ